MFTNEEIVSAFTKHGTKTEAAKALRMPRRTYHDRLMKALEGGVLPAVSTMRILQLDIETAPNVAHVWGLWQQNVGLNQLLASGYVMCWCAKWYGEDEIMFDSIMKSTPENMLERVRKLLDEADTLVHYNGTNFDIPTLNKEFLQHNMLPPSPCKHVDLLRVARASFRFPSNKLDYVAKALGLGGKIKHSGHELWIRCMAKEPEAWKQMEAYNRQDVLLLEQVYDRMKPWIKSHPNHGLYTQTDAPVCPNCASANVECNGDAFTAVSQFQRYRCLDCGAWSRGGESMTTKADRASILRSV